MTSPYFPNPVVPKQEPVFDVEKCWFCDEKKALKPDLHIKVALHRNGKEIGEELDSQGKAIKQYAIEAINFPVPRCEGCEQVHHMRPLLANGPVLGVLVLLIGILAWQFNSLASQDDWFRIFETLAYGAVALLLAGTFSRAALAKLASAIPSEIYANQYPVLAQLKTNGWLLGAGPRKAQKQEGKQTVTQAKV